MHEFSVNVGQLREALLTLSEYRPREREYYEEIEALSRTSDGLFDFTDYQFDDDVCFDIMSTSLSARIKCKGYFVSVNIPCKSNEIRISFITHLNKLLSKLELLNLDTVLVCKENDIYSYCLGTYFDFFALRTNKWPSYPIPGLELFHSVPYPFFEQLTKRYGSFIWEFPEDSSTDYVWFNIVDGICTSWATHSSWIIKNKTAVKLPNIKQYGIHSVIVQKLIPIVRDNNKTSFSIAKYDGYSYLKYGSIIIAMKDRFDFTASRKDENTIDQAFSQFIPKRKMQIQKSSLLNVCRRAKSVCAYTDRIILHALGGYLFCHCYDYQTSIDEYIPVNEGGCHDISWNVNINSLENMVSDISTQYFYLHYIDSYFQYPIIISQNSNHEEEETIRMCGTRILNDDDLKRIDLQEEKLFQFIKKNETNKQNLCKPMADEIISFEIGKKFPYPIEVGRDSTLPVPTYDGLSVIMSYCNLTQQEIESILDKPCKIGLVQLGIIPFMVFNFNNVIQQDISLNIQKLKEAEKKGWLDNAENRMFTIYLVEGTDGRLVGIRRFELSLLDDLRTVCSYQLDSKMEEIDYMIQVNESMYDIHRMWSKAFKIEDVDAPFVL